MNQPENCKKKCEWMECLAGMGLAGAGRCFLMGGWWMFCCPHFIDEEPYLYLYLHGKMKEK
jgi:hypothetical protein